MPIVRQRKLSYGEERDNQRRAQGELARPSNTCTRSKKIGNLWYVFHQRPLHRTAIDNKTI